MNGYFSPMDPNDLLCMAWKWQRGDVSRHELICDIKSALAFHSVVMGANPPDY
jgi:hypothetical protein